MAFNLLFEIIQPSMAFALTGGPSQPEVQSFAPVGTSDMVDIFTGDFKYNIPLMDVGGYPINMCYNSGITMDQEASWVGLGWNINPGVINRNMRGIPDDFNGENVKQDFNMRANRTFGLTAGFSGEAFGLSFLQLGYTLGVNYNNYNGVGFEQSFSPSITASSGGDEPNTASLGLNFHTNADGLNISPTVSFSESTREKKGQDAKLGASIGVSINSRSGMKSLTMGFSNQLSNTAAGNGPLESSKKKNENRVEGSNGGSPISLVDNTYIPQIDFARINTSLSFSTKFGGHLFGASGTYDIGGYYSENDLLSNSKSLPAYGYLNEQNGAQLDEVMMDFNREKDGSFTRNSTNLPLTNHSYDIYSIAGQGIGGMFRPFRGDVGSVHDSHVASISASGTVGLEVGTGNLFHLGVDVSVNAVTSHSGNWTSGNRALGNLQFQSATNGSTFEPVYFKEAGEKSVSSDASFFNRVGNYEAVKVPIMAGPGFQSTTSNVLTDKWGSPTPINGSITRTQRDKRNQCISSLTMQDAKQFGVEGYTASPQYAQPYHLSEMSVVRTDGARYIYGIPAYNTLQKEVSFNISGTAGDCSTGLVPYTATDASLGNQNGLDHYYNATTTPAFAHSYLLTSVLSSDYVDVDAVRGPSPGDLGTYTHFDYDGDPNTAGQQPAIANYRWRTPYNAGMANYSEGLKSDVSDNRASYIYGEKEIWYLNKIDTKTYVAIFHKSKRHDAYEAAGESGGLGQDAMMKLDSISLYSLPDYTANGNLAVPIKRVHFEYDYSQCQGVPNNDNAQVDGSGNPIVNQHGKLTLLKIYFTYGNSRKGKLSGYNFTYSDPKHDKSIISNPNYNIKGYDRWGFYKPNKPAVSGDNCDAVTGPLSAPEYPYVTQDTTQQAIYAASWTLTSIQTPSGANINVDYESDDYAYVQDKPAMQMFPIAGVGNSSGSFNPPLPFNGMNPANPNYPANPSSPLFSQLYANDLTVNEYVYFNLPENLINDPHAAQTFQNEYIRDLLAPNQNMYFKCLTDLTNTGTAATHEFVPGYCQIKAAGLVGTAPYTYGWVQLNKTYRGDGSSTLVNPISKAAWQFGRMHNPRLVYGMPDPANGTSFESVMQALANSGLITQAVKFFQGANGQLQLQGYAQNIVPSSSWIRLYSPHGKKLGGGARVKRLVMYDNWDQMQANVPVGTAANYGQEYKYLAEDGTSSGVASYEPILGGDENVFRQPVFVSTEHLLAPDDKHYLEMPFGESFFPAPGVGYSRVVVQNLERFAPNVRDGVYVKNHGTGYVVHEFYTAKDFPTITDQTDLDPLQQKTSALASLFNIAVKDYMTATQGYVIELNDMHGKPRKQMVYAQGQDKPISGVEYKYSTAPVVHTYLSTGTTVSQTKLDNTVQVIGKDNTVTSAEVGVDFDFVTDFREQATHSQSMTAQGNLAAFLATIFPIAVPTIFPGYTSQKTRFRSAVTTKVINRYGILRETVAYDLGSQVSTENLAYDGATGEVLLTKTKNEFNDPVYNFTYPAHWAYDRMGQAYRNIGYTVTLPPTLGLGAGGLVPSQGNYFVKGDEVAVSQWTFPTTFPPTPPFLTSLGKAWVWDTDNDITNGFWLIDAYGNPFNSAAIPNVSLTVLRSGRRNMQEIPVGTITTSNNPIVGTALSFSAFTTKILNASATEFSENWGLYCDEKAKAAGTDGTTASCVCTPDYGVIAEFNNVFQYLISHGGICASAPITVPASYFPTFLVSRPSMASVHFTSDFTTGNCPSTGQIDWFIYGGIPECTLILDARSGSSPLSNLPQGFTWANLVSLQITDVKGGCDGNRPTLAVSTAIFNNGITTFTTEVDLTCACLHFGTCTPPPPCAAPLHNIVNPYVAGVRGDWRSLRSHVFQTDRFQQLASNNNTNIRTDGQYLNFATFWNPGAAVASGAAPLDWVSNNTNWTFTSEVTKFSPFSFETENKDALNRYSGALYGYGNTLPKAVASNARYNQIASDGFEDYAFMNPQVCCPGHFDFYADKANLVQTESHTGRFSMKLPAGSAPGNPFNATRTLITAPCNPAADDMPYTVKDCDMIGLFAPHTYEGNKEYIASYWVKQATGNNARIFDYPNTALNIYFNASTTPRVPTTISKSDIIDGWQRVEYRFNILGTDVGDIKVEFVNSGTNDAFIDDIRIQPFNSSMKAFVYDPISLRLWAELDERNFATLYEYDEEGTLLRIKKETEKGIMTIQESRNNTIKQYKTTTGYPSNPITQ